MSKRSCAMIVAFLEQDNLGVGYLVSRLMQEDLAVKVVDFRAGKERILTSIREENPSLIGFSVIFQYHIYEFKELIDYLRQNGVGCHFTAGGHYPSLRYEETFKIIKQLDSIVLFEGEHTFAQLVAKLDRGEDWKGIEGIAYQNGTRVHQNRLRPLEEELDVFPPPARQPLKEYVLGKKYSTLLAGRGCFYNCSFCSIRRFYSRPPGPVKRLRRPEMVVREMELLYHERDCTVFMFQDDDFPVTAHRGSWIEDFCSLLSEKGLVGEILWKINCRADEVSSETFKMMRDAGLFLVYLGIESGTEQGLKLMNKRLQPSDNYQAITILKHLDIGFDFGFMLFEPSSTFESVETNLHFLDQICGDGASPITFCKMVPYAETRIEETLEQQDRLKGKLGSYDYDFLEKNLNLLCPFLMNSFQDWISSHDGVLNLARWARYNMLVAAHLYPATEELQSLKGRVWYLVAESNSYFLQTVGKTIEIVTGETQVILQTQLLQEVRLEVEQRHEHWRKLFLAILNEFDELQLGELVA